MDDSVKGPVPPQNGHVSQLHRSHLPLVERLMAISRDSALEEMASGISHELNQPLGAIVTFSQVGERILNQSGASTEQVREIFQMISKEALAAAEGIRHMRQLFRRDALDRCSCAIDEVIDELRSVLRLLADNFNVALSLEIDGDLPKVNIDRLRIQHVLFTLVQNAIEASAGANGKRTVAINAHGDRYGVQVAIRDTGPGIALIHRAQIFHPFFTTKTNGTGLGLASARAIVEAHEGTIGFSAEPGEPTLFWFRLPAGSN